MANDYFTSNALLKFTVWKDNEQAEAKSFGAPLPLMLVNSTNFSFVV